MSFASRYHNFLRHMRVPAIVTVLLVWGTFFWLQARLPQAPAPDASPPPPPLAWRGPPAGGTLDWMRFRASGGSRALGQPDFAGAFRFAGTFFLSGEGGAEIRKAVLGVIAEKRQVIASEGDEIAGVTVIRILPDRVVLKRGTEIAELWLSFMSREGNAAEADNVEDPEGSTTSPFGERVADDRWEFSRASLLSYYNTLLEAPERLLQVFDSLKPLYDTDGKIEGYQLGVEGEGDFFRAVGLREGDVVRKVNSLEMTNRNRAEFFIRQVVQNKLSAVVIDIEREGSPKRLVYQVRE